MTTQAAPASSTAFSAEQRAALKTLAFRFIDQITKAASAVGRVDDASSSSLFTERNALSARLKSEMQALGVSVLPLKRLGYTDAKTGKALFLRLNEKTVINGSHTRLENAEACLVAKFDAFQKLVAQTGNSAEALTVFLQTELQALLSKPEVSLEWTPSKPRGFDEHSASLKSVPDKLWDMIQKLWKIRTDILQQDKNKLAATEEEEEDDDKALKDILLQSLRKASTAEQTRVVALPDGRSLTMKYVKKSVYKPVNSNKRLMESVSQVSASISARYSVLSNKINFEKAVREALAEFIRVNTVDEDDVVFSLPRGSTKRRAEAPLPETMSSSKRVQRQ